MAKRQLEIAGTERVKNQEVEAAAEGYVDQRNKRMKLSKKEKEAKQALIAVMNKHKLSVYRDDTQNPPVIVTLSSKDDVRVQELGDEPEEVEEEEASAS